MSFLQSYSKNEGLKKNCFCQGLTKQTNVQLNLTSFPNVSGKNICIATDENRSSAIHRATKRMKLTTLKNYFAIMVIQLPKNIFKLIFLFFCIQMIAKRGFKKKI